MSRVDFFRDLGLDVETAVILDDELSSLPARTQRVFELRVSGYTQQSVADIEGVYRNTVQHHEIKLKKLISDLSFG